MARGGIRGRAALLSSGRLFPRGGSKGVALPVALAVGMIVLAAVVLGAWGWVEQGRRDPAYEARWPTIASRTLALFVLDSGGVGDAPWQLEVGRLLAPLATATVALNLVFTSSSERLHRSSARHASGHRVLIGPPDRIQPYLENLERAPTVHAIDHNDDPVDGVIRTRVDWVGDDWIGATAAGAAGEIVIATGEDDRNLGLLGELLAARSGRPGPGAMIVVEVDDPDLVLWLSVSLAEQDPESDVEIVCWLDTIARRAANTAWHAALEGQGQAEIPCVAVLGDGDAAGLVGLRLAEHIERWAGSSDAPKGRKPALRCIDFPGPCGTFDRVTIRQGVGIDDLTVDPSPHAALAFYDDLPTSFRRGAELRARIPSCQVFVPSRTEQVLAGLRSIDMTSRRLGAQLNLDLEGPLTRVARTRYEIWSRTEKLAPWSERSERYRREYVRQLRLLVRVASRSEDLRLDVGELDGPAVLPTEVTQRLRYRLREAGRALMPRSSEMLGPERLEDARDLGNAPYWFAVSNLSLVARSHRGVGERE